jgi:hypothetical protein
VPSHTPAGPGALSLGRPVRPGLDTGGEMSEGTCRTCPWWHRTASFSSGQCQAHPPTPVLVRARMTGDYDERVEYENEHWFPAMGEDDWCGEHPDRKEAS